jgi:hypothetical protein
VGDEAPTLCLKREYRPLIRPLTKSLGPGTRGLTVRLLSKSLNEVRVSVREAVVWMWSSSFCNASLSTVSELSDESEARLEAGDASMLPGVGRPGRSAGYRGLYVHGSPFFDVVLFLSLFPSVRRREGSKARSRR